MTDQLLHDIIGPLLGLSIAAISAAVVWILTRRTHAEKDVLHQQTLGLYESQNRELRLQNAEYRGKVDENTKRIGDLQSELGVWQERITQKAAVDELATWSTHVADAAQQRDEAIRIELAGLRADTAKWQAEEAKAREEGRRASAEEHRALVEAIENLPRELGPASKRATKIQAKQVQVSS